MLNAFLILVLILLYTFQGFFCKKFTEHYPGEEKKASPVFAIFSGLFVSIVAFIASGFKTDIQPLTLLLGVCNGLTLYIYNIAMIRSSQTGPYSILMVFSLSGGIAIPAVINFFVYKQAISILSALCILVLFAAVYLVSRKEGEAFANRKVFFPMCLLLGLTNGAYGSFLSVQQNETGDGDKMSMVAITFFVEVLLAAITLAVKERKNFFTVMKQTKKSALWLSLYSIVAASAILMLVSLITRMGDSIHILYTFDNAGTLLFSVLVSVIFLKEKLSAINWIGAVLMCAALVGVAVF